MKHYIDLPDDKEALAAIIDAHVDREESAAVHRHLRWWLCYVYLAMGVRHFSAFDARTGLLRWEWKDKDGKIGYASQELLSRITKITGRLEAMDLAPLVMKTGWTLSSIRQRATGQVIADSIIDWHQLRKNQKQMAFILSTLGCAGVCGYVTDHPTIGITADLDCVHPRELFPFPSLGTDYTRECGHVRQHTVSLKWLEKRYKTTFSEEQKNKMLVYKTRAGEVSDEDRLGVATASTWFDGNAGGSGPPQKDQAEVVKIRETWIRGPRGTVKRYCITSGHHTIYDQKLEDAEVYPSVEVMRFMENGTFHGAGLFDLFFPAIREHERLLESLYNNVRDSDQYGVVILPQGTYDKDNLLTNVGRGLRAMFVSFDSVDTPFTPFTLQPHNAGDMPGRVSALARQEIDAIDPLPNLWDEKGRAESSLALQVLDEKINQGMNNVTSSIQTAYGCIYREMTRDACEKMLSSDRAIPISKITMDMLGVVIDPIAGTASFSNNPLPDLSRLEFGVREVNPRSKVGRKQEALALLPLQAQTDPNAFKKLIFLDLEEGLDFAVWKEEERAARDTIVNDCVMLYGDGQSPGKVRIAQYTTRPDIQLIYLAVVLSGPHMRQASSEVKAAFMQYRDQLMHFAGMMTPNPLPDDVALFNQSTAPPPPTSQPGMDPMMAPQGQPANV